MSALIMTPTDRIQALKRFGYSDAAALFLTRAALHGGYFLRRQVAQFLGRRDGGVVTQLVQRALDLGHVRTSTWRQNTLLYHLCSRTFYEALGESDNRNRRQHELAQIKNRIMGLDFVLSRLDEQYLTTEHEKLECFDRRQIDREKLPGKVFRSRDGRHCVARYFIDKYPLFLTEVHAGEARCVPTFTFVDEGLVTLSRFERYLVEYGPLFGSLGPFSLVYIADAATHFVAARAMFERLCQRTVQSNGPSTEPASDRLLTYFELRKRFEDREFASFDRGQLLLFRDAKDAFASPEYEALYRRWRASGRLDPQAVRPRNASTQPAILGSFSTELLSHDYTLFGHFLPQ